MCSLKGNLNNVGQSKLKILAFHGYRQNGNTFRKKTGSFRKVTSKWADFTYITAPHKVNVPDPSESTDVGQTDEDQLYSWFFNSEDRSFRGIRIGGPAIGFDDSVKVIEETFEKLGPFDGILGFSQGACLVSLLCHLKEKKMLKACFNFAVMIAGFKSASLPHADYYKETITIPTLHVFGETDQIIPPQMSRDLYECFESPQVVNHPGGHFVPASSNLKEAYENFFKLCYELKNGSDCNRV